MISFNSACPPPLIRLGGGTGPGPPSSCAPESAILKYFLLYDVIILKWNKCVISSDPPFIEWYVRYTFRTFISQIVSEARNALVTFVEKPQIQIISFQNGKHGYLM